MSKACRGIYDDRCAIVRLLIDHGGDVNEETTLYGTPLIAAADSVAGGNVMRLLLEKGAKLTCAVGQDALHAAIRVNNVAAIDILHEYGVDLNAEGLQGSQAVHTFPLHASILVHGVHRGEGPQAMDRLLEHGADVHKLDRICGSILQSAAQPPVIYDNSRKFKLLLRYGADVNQSGGLLGNPLQAAARFSRPNTVKLFLNHGASINAKGGKYGNALQAAVVGKATYKRGVGDQIVSFLISQGADVHAEGGKYGTALRAALYKGIHDVAHILLTNEARLDGGCASNLPLFSKRVREHDRSLLRALLARFNIVWQEGRLSILHHKSMDMSAYIITKQIICLLTITL